MISIILQKTVQNLICLSGLEIAFPLDPRACGLYDRGKICTMFLTRKPEGGRPPGKHTHRKGG